MVDRSETWLGHTDFIAEEHDLVCWQYSLGTLEREYPLFPVRPVFAAVLRSLKALSESPRKRLRERSFTVWAGDHGDCFCVGLPQRISAEVAEFIACDLRSVPGYEAVRYVSTPYVPLSPALRYERGRVIQYSEECVVGMERLDDDRWYGSGLTILHRVWLPAAILGKEKYQG